MDLKFTAEQDMLRQSIAEFLKNECTYDVAKTIQESPEGYSPEIWKKLGDLGCMAIIIPEEYEGIGDSFLSLLIVLEEMGKVGLQSPFFETVVLCGLTIMEGGSEKQKNELLSQISTGKLIMSLAHRQTKPELEYCPEEIIVAEELDDSIMLNGKILFVRDAKIANKLIVPVSTDDDITLLIVDASNPGLKISKMPTLGSNNMYEVEFNTVRVDKNDIIGEPGQGVRILQKVMQMGMVAKSAEMLGESRAAIKEAVEHAKTRVQYGVPIGGQQSIQHLLANMEIAYETCLSYLHRVAWMVEEGMDISLEAHLLKARVNEQCNFITYSAVRIFGTYGTTNEYIVSMFFRNAKASELLYGDTTSLYEKVSQSLGL